MATYVNDLRLKEIGTGESAGTWGTETNVNLELIGEALSFGTESITTNADTHTSTVADGSTDPARSMFIKYTGTLDSACTITIAPNTLSRVHLIENGTSGSQNIIISQGSGANVTIPPGDVKAVYLDGAGSGAAVVDAFASLNVVDLKVEDDLTVTDDLIVNGDIDLEGSIDVNGSTSLDDLNVELDDNAASPVTMQQGSNTYFKIVTTNSSETVELGNTTTNPNILLGGGTTYIGGETGPTLEGLAILAGNENGGIQINRETGTPSSGEGLGSLGFKGQSSANTNAAAEASIAAFAEENFTGSTAATGLRFSTKPTGTGPGSAPTERMRIDSTGALRINNSRTTSTNLHVVGGTSSGTIFDTAVFAGGQNSTSGSGARLYLSGCENDPISRGTLIQGEATDNSNAHALVFKVSAASSSPAEQLRITSSGRLLHGTSTIPTK